MNLTKVTQVVQENIFPTLLRLSYGPAAGPAVDLAVDQCSISHGLVNGRSGQ